MNHLAVISESDKRLIIAFFLVFVLFFVIIGIIGYFIVRTMKWQGKRLDSKVSDVVFTRVITDKKIFKKYAFKKNWIIFYKAIRIPVLIMLISGLVLLIRNIVNHNFSYNFFSTEEGFGSILYCWDFRNCFVFKPKSFSFNFPVLIHQPEFSLQMLSKAWASYIFVPGMTIGGLWYLWCVQSLISRMIRIHKLSDSIFDKNLDNFNQNEQLMNSISNTLKKVESPQNRDKISNN